MMRAPHFARDRSAATAAEFTLVLPVLVIFLLGMIDVGRFMWTLNQIEKATQMGARFAVVTDPVAAILNNDFVASDSIPGGDPVPTGVFTRAVCTNTGDCTITGTRNVPGRNPTAFTNLVSWMRTFYPGISAANVRVTYENVGLGYAGDPGGPDVATLTTVEAYNMTFKPFVLFGAGTINIPPVKAMLTLEDAECTTSGDCQTSN